jgi:hypothetical protein
MSEDSVKLPEPKQMCADPCRTCVDHDEDCEDLQALRNNLWKRAL